MPIRDAELLMLATTAACAPIPAGSMHSIDVVEIQMLVVHCVAPMDVVGDVPVGPKFEPDRVSREPPEVGPFVGRASVSTGAAQFNSPVPCIDAADPPHEADAGYQIMRRPYRPC